MTRFMRQVNKTVSVLYGSEDTAMKAMHIKLSAIWETQGYFDAIQFREALDSFIKEHVKLDEEIDDETDMYIAILTLQHSLHFYIHMLREEGQ